MPVKWIVYFVPCVIGALGIYWLWPSASSEEPSSPKVVLDSHSTPSHKSNPIPEVDRINELFSLTDPKLPIVETITYTSRPSWIKGKSAWLSDYANHYKTNRHFIARSLNKKADYQKEIVKEGDRFNVLKLDENFYFHLVLDISASKLLFYFVDQDSNQAELIKTYAVSIGAGDSSSPSGSLTPLGKYSLGGKVAAYDAKMVGFHQGKKTEMVKVYGTRWIPFDKEIEDCTSPAKGLGLQGMPWIEDPLTKQLFDQNETKPCEQDGCIRLKTADIEELYSIITSRSAVIEIVKDYNEAVQKFQGRG